MGAEGAVVFAENEIALGIDTLKSQGEEEVSKDEFAFRFFWLLNEWQFPDRIEPVIHSKMPLLFLCSGKDAKPFQNLPLFCLE